MKANAISTITKSLPIALSVLVNYYLLADFSFSNLFKYKSLNVMTNLASETSSLIQILEHRFHKNLHRHPEVKWAQIESVLASNPAYVSVIQHMEDSGGEPDVIEFSSDLYADFNSGTAAKLNDIPAAGIYFVDWSKESPKGRRSCCYDHASRLQRKDFPPQSSALEIAQEIGIEILSEVEYKFMQSLSSFDLKTSSWIATPSAIRKLSGALFADNRYEHIFVYHNGASSYYAARGFRGKFKILSI